MLDVILFVLANKYLDEYRNKKDNFHLYEMKKKKKYYFVLFVFKTESTSNKIGSFSLKNSKSYIFINIIVNVVVIFVIFVMNSLRYDHITLYHTKMHSNIQKAMLLL